MTFLILLIIVNTCLSKLCLISRYFPESLIIPFTLMTFLYPCCMFLVKDKQNGTQWLKQPRVPAFRRL